MSGNNEEADDYKKKSEAAKVEVKDIQEKCDEILKILENSKKELDILSPDVKNAQDNEKVIVKKMDLLKVQLLEVEKMQKDSYPQISPEQSVKEQDEMQKDLRDLENKFWEYLKINNLLTSSQMVLENAKKNPNITSASIVEGNLRIFYKDMIGGIVSLYEYPYNDNKKPEDPFEIKPIFFSLVKSDYGKLVKGKYEMPVAIKKTINVFETEPFLNSNDQFIRMAAAKRFGELKDKKGVELLFNRFEKELYGVGERALIVELEIIRSLEKIGGEEAKYALLNILEDYWRKGPSLAEGKSKGYYRHDGNFSTAVPLTLEMLKKWNQDNDAIEKVQEIALSEDVVKYYSDIGIKAWKVLLIKDIKEEGINDEIKSALYIVDLIEKLDKNNIFFDIIGSASDLEKDENRNVILLYLKIRALKDILASEISENILSALKKEFEEEINKEPPVPLGSKASEKEMEIGIKLGYVCRALEEKVNSKY